MSNAHLHKIQDDLITAELSRANTLSIENDALRAENARLREALAKVCLELECSADPIYIQMGSWLRGRLAQAALQPKEAQP